MLARTLATTATGTGIAMAVAGAAGRGATPSQQVLLGSMAVLMTVGAQTLPALGRGRVLVWPVWAGCLVMSVYAQAQFFSKSHTDAGAARAAQVQSSTQAAALDAQLAHITARPAPEVLARIATTRARIERTGQIKARADLDALNAELADAQQAATLRAQRQALAAQHDEAQASAAADPIDSAIGAALGTSPTRASQIMAVLQGLLIELIGALLWSIALPARQAAPQTTQTPRTTPRQRSGPVVRVLPNLNALVQRVRGIAKAREQPKAATRSAA